MSKKETKGKLSNREVAYETFNWRKGQAPKSTSVSAEGLIVPTISLEPNIKIIDGSGTKTSPYILSF